MVFFCFHTHYVEKLFALDFNDNPPPKKKIGKDTLANATKATPSENAHPRWEKRMDVGRIELSTSRMVIT